MENMLYHHLPKFFDADELIDPVTLMAMRDRGLDPWILFRPELLYSLDGVREFIGRAIFVNNWDTDANKKLHGNLLYNKEWLLTRAGGLGLRAFRGFRPRWYDGGGELSQHRLGCAVDFDVQGVTAEDVQLAIMKNHNDPRLSLIRRMERGVSWVHIDVAPSISNQIILFNK